LGADARSAGCGRNKTRKCLMDLRKLKTLIDLVSDSNISELEITEAEGKVRIVKGPVGGAVAPVYMQAPSGAPTQLMAPAQAAVVAAPSVAETPAEPVGKVIQSPMVGTFYRSASPGAKAFAEVGDHVKPGEPVCIIEAMKIMNEIEADCEGKVLRILCENGQAVEFGQPLFIVE
jgi:acetyl-CoA carboxylase biotin carboxyl carrier protein